MKWVLSLLAVLPLVAWASDDGYAWKREVQIDDVSITVEVMGLDTKMNAIRAKYGRRGPEGALRTRLFGYSVLFRNSETGAYRCSIYLLREGDEETLAHETRHCYGWGH